MSIPESHNIGGYLRAEPIFNSSAVVTMTSDGAPNATELLGRIIDRQALGRHYLSAKVVLNVQYNSSGASTVAGVRMTTRVLHATSTAAGDFSNFDSTGITTSFVSTATSTSVVGVHVHDLDLRTARRYLQVEMTPNFVASSSGGLRYGGAILFGGADELPPVAAVVRATTS